MLQAVPLLLLLQAAASVQLVADQTDPDGRRSIRGAPVEPPPSESPELLELRRFEERTFPRVVHEGGPPDPAQVDAEDQTDVPEKLRGASGPGPNAAFLKQLKLPDLPVRWDTRLLRYLEFYRSDPKGRAIMATWLRKQGRWRAMMEEVLGRHDLPRALVYVSMIESGYEPTDLSRVGASGLWQFMEAGGKIYGLNRSYWIDERRSPERSTEAVAIYLHDLYVRFGNWHMALAAFNVGYGAVLKSMQKYNTNDFWELCKHESGLPWETCLYVPKVLATAIVGINRKAFGFEDVQPEPGFAYDSARVPGGTMVGAVARACGAGEADLAQLNPELRRNRVPPGRDYTLRIPAGTIEKFAQAFPTAKTDLDRYEVHVLKFGERLEDVARIRHMSVRELKRLNGITDSSEVRGGTELLVPKKPSKVSEADEPPAAEEDEELIVAVPDRVFSYPDRKRVFYRTRDGDTTAEIAEFFGVGEVDLAVWNHLDLGTRLASKMVLQIFAPRRLDLSGAVLQPEERLRIVTVGSEEFLQAFEAKRGRKRISYICKAGDTLAKVGRRFGLTPGDLARINQFSYATELAPGQEIIVYMPVTTQAKREAQGRLRQAARLAAKFAPARHRAGAGKPHKK
jgi:membrane-bound lytic murein transglycosylase D